MSTASIDYVDHQNQSETGHARGTLIDLTYIETVDMLHESADSDRTSFELASSSPESILAARYTRTWECLDVVRAERAETKSFNHEARFHHMHDALSIMQPYAASGTPIHFGSRTVAMLPPRPRPAAA